MQRVGLVAVIGLASLAPACLGAESIHYRITVDPARAPVVAVRMELSGFPREPLVLGMPFGYASVRPEEDGVADVVGRGATGERLEPRRVGAELYSWDVAPDAVEYTVRVTHRVQVEEQARLGGLVADGREQPYLDNRQGLLTGGALLLIPDRWDLTATVEVEVPVDWSVVAAWPRSDGVYRPGTLRSLVQEYIAVGAWTASEVAPGLSVAAAPWSAEQHRSLAIEAPAIAAWLDATLGPVEGGPTVLLVVDGSPTAAPLARASGGSLLLSPTSASPLERRRMVARLLLELRERGRRPRAPDLDAVLSAAYDYLGAMACAGAELEPPSVFAGWFGGLVEAQRALPPGLTVRQLLGSTDPASRDALRTLATLRAAEMDARLRLASQGVRSLASALRASPAAGLSEQPVLAQPLGLDEWLAGLATWWPDAPRGAFDLGIDQPTPWLMDDLLTALVGDAPGAVAAGTSPLPDGCLLAQAMRGPAGAVASLDGDRLVALLGTRALPDWRPSLSAPDKPVPPPIPLLDSRLASLLEGPAAASWKQRLRAPDALETFPLDDTRLASLLPREASARWRQGLAAPDKPIVFPLADTRLAALLGHTAPARWQQGLAARDKPIVFPLADTRLAALLGHTAPARWQQGLAARDKPIVFPLADTRLAALLARDAPPRWRRGLAARDKPAVLPLADTRLVALLGAPHDAGWSAGLQAPDKRPGPVKPPAGDPPLTALLGSGGTGAPAGPLRLSYTVKLEPPRFPLVGVEVKVESAPAGPFRLAMPLGYAYQNVTRDYVESLVARDAAGKEIPLLPGMKEGYAWASAPKTVSYSVRASHRDEVRKLVTDGSALSDAYEHPFANATGALLPGAAFLMSVPGADAPATVRVSAPKGWRVIVPWRPKGTGYEVPSSRALAANYIAAGDWEMTESDAGGLTARIAFAKGTTLDRSAVTAGIAKLLEAIEALMGPPPVDECCVFFTIPGDRDDFAGSTKERSILLVLPRDGGAGDEAEVLRLFAHEAIHLYSHASRPIAPDLRFFGEGFTEYWARVLCVRAGVHSPQQFARTLGATIGLIEGFPPGLSLRKAQQGFFDSLQSAQFCYFGGLLRALELDLGLRDLEEPHTLDEAMAALRQRLGPGADPVGSDEWHAALRGWLPEAPAALFDMRLDETLPWGTTGILDRAGLLRGPGSAESVKFVEGAPIRGILESPSGS